MLDPILVTLIGFTEPPAEIEIPNHPLDESMGSRKVLAAPLCGVSARRGWCFRAVNEPAMWTSPHALTQRWEVPAQMWARVGQVPFSGNRVYIDREDFRLEAPDDYFRLKPDGEYPEYPWTQ